MDKLFLSKDVQQPYLDQIKSGEKRYEGRLKTKIQEWGLKVGQRIKFYDKENPDSWVLVEVSHLKIFSDFGVAFDELGSSLLSHKTRNEVIQIYNNIYKDEKEDVTKGKDEPTNNIKKNGVVAIGVKVITYRPLFE